LLLLLFKKRRRKMPRTAEKTPESGGSLNGPRGELVGSISFSLYGIQENLEQRTFSYLLSISKETKKSRF
jgi:hypothetical protein